MLTTVFSFVIVRLFFYFRSFPKKESCFNCFFSNLFVVDSASILCGANYTFYLSLQLSFKIKNSFRSSECNWIRDINNCKKNIYIYIYYYRLFTFFFFGTFTTLPVGKMEFSQKFLTKLCWLSCSKKEGDVIVPSFDFETSSR